MGLIDVLIAANIFALSYGWSIRTLVLVCAAYLIIKGLIFLKDIVSIVEGVIGVVMLIGLFIALPKILLVIFGVFILQKGIFSLFA